ncbi:MULTISPECIES: sugar phosphate isomerase/epimerase [unclassified Arcicella]|uniref:sugar phosphate isomerase/epimerase family protein n=1 Tax=unclassified Arcicella TaxID=2644986 RepID=UPI002865DD25|nr:MULTISPECIES: sugar phosphate isomerase/epimerase [unclassified Arcicella]MDR6562307.1 sugar phosphate isomerase/epimerase [Arcicella sp. BE51]MDR6811998.1 sugar phosphate isomerase/epimerase [Arcicella sp. BE140]MDR6823309.1 sugar phosphate isomerase/epimerase [Arcicella sp. BE139]
MFKYRQLLLFILLMNTGVLFAQKGKPLFTKTPGMVSYTFRNSFAKDVAATLDTLKSLGITDIEFSNLFGKKASEIRQLLDDRGQKCSSFGVSYSDAQNKTAEVGQNAKTLGASYVRVAWIMQKPPFTIADAQKAVETFNKIGKQLKDDFGLTFCYHNHGYEFEKYEDGTLMDYIIQKTDPKYVSFEIDILWTFFPGADPAALIAKYPKRFKLMHVKDLRKGIVGNLSGGTPVENDVALGTGQIDIPSVLKAANKSSIEHFYIEDESPSYGTQVPKSIAYLKSLKR